MLDSYVFGSVRRISPEAPIQVLDVTEERDVVGGAGNVAAKVAELGGRAVLVSVVGNDHYARRLKKLLNVKQIDIDLMIDPDRPTTHKTRFISNGQQLLRADREVHEPISVAMERRLVTAVKRAVAGVDVIVLQDYNKGLLTPKLISAVYAVARKREIPVLVDPKDRPFSIYKGATAIKPNAAEVSAELGRPIATDVEFVRAGRDVLRRTGAQVAFITRGAEGMTVVERGQRAAMVETRRQPVFDPTGAGDAVVAVLALAMAGGVSACAAAELANLAGGLVVSQVGNGFISASTLRGAAEGNAGGKILSRQELIRALADHRTAGGRIVFTNGVFDLLHVGHIKSLEIARGYGDVLVVGINSDASTRRLKGAGRPYLLQDERTRLLSSLACVDYVCVFDEQTPLAIIKAVKPDVLCKGEDYSSKKDVVGWGVVESYGGEVRRIPLVKGISTTELVKRIRQKGPPCR